MSQVYKIRDTDSGEGLDTHSERRAAEYLEKIGGSGVDYTTYTLKVVDTISGNVTGGASICYGVRVIEPMTSSLMVDALHLANFRWANYDS